MRVSSKINDEWVASKKVSKTVILEPTKKKWKEKKTLIFNIKLNLCNIKRHFKKKHPNIINFDC